MGGYGTHDNAQVHDFLATDDHFMFTPFGKDWSLGVGVYAHRSVDPIFETVVVHEEAMVIAQMMNY